MELHGIDLDIKNEFFGSRRNPLLDFVDDLEDDSRTVLERTSVLVGTLVGGSERWMRRADENVETRKGRTRAKEEVGREEESRLTEPKILKREERETKRGRRSETFFLSFFLLAFSTSKETYVRANIRD